MELAKVELLDQQLSAPLLLKNVEQNGHFWGDLLRLCAEIWSPSQKMLSLQLTCTASMHVACSLQDQKAIASR